MAAIELLDRAASMWLSNIRIGAAGAMVALGVVTPHQTVRAQEITLPSAGRAQLGFGHQDVDGAEDRDFAWLFLNLDVGESTNLLFDAATTRREENTSFASVGIEREYGTGTYGFRLGTSDSDLGIYPEFLAALTYERITPAEVGVVYRASFIYSDFATDTESYDFGVEAVKYFPADENGNYVVGQLGLNAILSEPGSEWGWELSGAATWVRENGWRYGIGGSLGTIGYEGALAQPVDNDFYALRPFLARAVGESSEIFLRGEFVDSDDFDIQGLSIGIDFSL